MPEPDEEPIKNTAGSASLNEDLYLLRKQIVGGIIDEASTVINMQSSINRSFRARTCPLAALAMDEAVLYQLTRK